MAERERKSETAGKTIDDETNSMIYQGVSMAQLSRIFSMDVGRVKDKIYGMAPVSTRGGHPIYSLAEAAKVLVDPEYPIDEYIRRMSVADLPMLLRKEYWAGRRSEQIFQQAAGDLWPTDKVIDHISTILKVISMSLRLSVDVVERELGLTPAQRALMVRLNDEALATAHRELEKMLDERQETLRAQDTATFDEEI